MNILYKLNYAYFKRHKKSYISISIGVLLSTFLIMSVLVARDSYRDFSIRTTIYTTGAWEVDMPVNNNSDKVEGLSDAIYIQDLPFTFDGQDFMYIRAVSEFNNTLGFHLLEGKYPDKNEVLVDSVLANQKNMKLGDRISFHTENGEVLYTVSGLYERLAVQQNAIFYMNGKVMEGFKPDRVKGILKDFNQLDKYIQDVRDMRVNDPLIHAKYGNRKLQTVMVFVAVMIVFACALLFLYTTYRIQMENRKRYLHQLHLLGTTKKQIGALIGIELLFVGGLTFIISTLLSYGLWYMVINGFSSLFMRLFNTRITLYCVLEGKSILVLSILMVIAFVLTGGLVITKLFHHKEKKLWFRNLQLKKCSVISRIGIIDILRKRTGTSIIISVFMGTLLFLCIQYTLGTWLDDKKENFAVYSHDIEANFSLYNLSSSDYAQFTNEASEFCSSADIETCDVEYSLQAQITIEENLRQGIFVTIDDKSYAKFVNNLDLASINEPILLNSYVVKTAGEMRKVENLVNKSKIQMKVDLLNMGNEKFTSYTDHAVVVNKDIYPYREVDDGQLLFLCSKSYVEDIVDRHPGGVISGSFKVNTDKAYEIEQKLNKSIRLRNNDFLYVNNLYERASIYEDFRTVNIVFITGFIGIILLLCVANIGNVLYQYLNSREKDRVLLRAIGMSEKQWKKQLLGQMSFYAIIGLASSFIISVYVNHVIYKYLLTGIVEDFQISYLAMAVCGAVFLLILYGTAYYYDYKVRKTHF